MSFSALSPFAWYIFTTRTHVPRLSTLVTCFRMRSFALARNEIIPHIVDIQDFFAFICVALRNKKRGHFDLFGAENGTRTRDLNLGKVALYQLSYFRNLQIINHLQALK